MDVAKIRELYPDFLMIGGFDKMCMFHTQKEIRAEMERLLPTMQKGRFLPAMDHQTPPGTPIENYRVYTALMKEYGKQVCADCI